jgi:hypothetical protein
MPNRVRIFLGAGAIVRRLQLAVRAVDGLMGGRLVPSPVGRMHVLTSGDVALIDHLPG